MLPAHANHINGDASVRAATLLNFPAEEPTRAQVEDWLDEAGPTLVRTGYGPAMRGEHPPHLISAAAAANAPEVEPLTAQQRTEISPLEATRHDLIVDKSRRDRATAARQLSAGLHEYHNKLAAILESSLRPHASLRLRALLAAHGVAGMPDCHNGGAMWRELASLRDSDNRLEDMRDHDRAVEEMRDNPLPDGCKAQDFADKVNTLTRNHLRFLERPLQGAALGKFIIALMPRSNQAEGRSLLRELNAIGELANIGLVIARCTEIVRDSAVKTPQGGVLASLLTNKGLNEAALCSVLQASGFSAAQATALAQIRRKPGGGGDKKKKYKGASRLAEGKTCKEGTCNFDHDRLAPGQPCFRSPHFKGPLPEKYSGNDGQVERIEAARKANALKMGVTYIPLIKSAPAVASAVVPVDDTCDGLDYCGVFDYNGLCCLIECPEADADGQDDSDSDYSAELDEYPHSEAEYSSDDDAIDGLDYADFFAAPTVNCVAMIKSEFGFEDERHYAQQAADSPDAPAVEHDSGDSDAGLSASCESDHSDVSEFAQWAVVTELFSPAEHVCGARACQRDARSPPPSSPVARPLRSMYVPETPERATPQGNTAALTRTTAPASVHVESQTQTPRHAGSSCKFGDPIAFSSTSPAELENVSSDSFVTRKHERLDPVSPFQFAPRAAFRAGAYAAAGMITVFLSLFACLAAYFAGPGFPAMAAALPVDIVDRLTSRSPRTHLDFAFAHASLGSPSRMLGLIFCAALLYHLLPALMDLALRLGLHSNRIIRRGFTSALRARQSCFAFAAFIQHLTVDVARTALKMAALIALCAYLCTPDIEDSTFVGALSLSRSTRTSRVLNLADSGAGIHAICDKRFAIPGTLRPNSTSILTAGGSTSPKLRCDAMIEVLTNTGKVLSLVLRDALVMDDSQHNLVSLGLLAREGVISHIGAGSEGSYLLFPDNNKVDLMNRGVLIIPDRDDAMMINSVIPPGQLGQNESMWQILHNRFNGRSFDTLRHLIGSGQNVSRDWHRALKHPPKTRCHSCLLSRAEKVPSRSRVPKVTEPGYFSYDIFEMGVRHMHGGQRYLIGFHDTYSTLNKVYLLHHKSDAHKAMDLVYAWARSHGVSIKRFHADNAPELTGPALTEKWASRGVRLTACAPNEPRGNGLMERQWRTISADARHALALAALPPGAWWYVTRASVYVSWSIPLNADETPWSRFTGRPSSPHIHRVVGCLAYYRVVKPESKAHMRARRAIHLGRAEGQPGYLLMDLESRKTLVTPHVRFVEDVFPGLTSRPGDREPSQHDIDRLFESRGDEPSSPDGPALPPSDDASEEDWGFNGHTALEHQETDMPSNSTLPPDDVMAPLGDPSSSSSIGDASDDPPSIEPTEVAGEIEQGGPDAATEDGFISSRLDRSRRRPVQRLAFEAHMPNADAPRADENSPMIPVPESGGYYMYIGAGPARDGDVASHLKELGGSPIICIDIKRGGYDHDITHSAVQDRLLAIAASARCLGVFVSIPCKTFSVLRGKPGMPHSYPLRDLDHVLGIPRADGTLPYKVVQSNIMSEFTARLMTIVHDKGGAFAAESPPSRSAGSRFPIEGREKHASQFDHPSWVSLRTATEARMIFFDQCPLYDDPLLTPRKKTALLVNPKGYAAFYSRFAPLVCQHGYDAHRVAYGLDDSGNFSSPSTENYPSRMNALIAEALIESCEPAMMSTPRSGVSFASPTALPPLTPPVASPAPLDLWHDYFVDSGDVIWPEQADVKDWPAPMTLLKAAGRSLGSAFSNTLYHTSIDNQLFAALRESSCDAPTFRQARASPEWPAWEKAMEDEIMNLRRNGTIDEDQSLLEDTLPSWNNTKGRASEVVNILWVLKKKYNDGVFDKYKARAVFDGRDQKAKNPELETFSPACRSTTHKLIAAEACRLGHRQRTWDVEAAYLKGVFPKDSKPLLGRPPPGFRQFINGVPLIWVLKTPLYGEADAGRIWYQTFIKFLIEERGFTQSRYDPCFFWKTLPDGSRLNCVIYVDDGYSTDNGSTFADAELEAINSRFKIVIHDASFFLGNNVTCHSRHKLTLSSRAYIDRIAKKYLSKPLGDYPPFDVPCDKSILSFYEDALSARRDGKPLNKSLQESYASKVGALIYVVPVCRVDCAFAIGMLARCLTFPTDDMDAAADRCLVFLAQHPDTGISYDANSTRPELHAFSDSNWSVGHSTSGWAVLYCGAVIGYGSKRQQSVALSSTEAEIMAASMAATEILYFRGLLFELGHELDPTVLYVDNQGAIELSKDMKSCQRSRHIERRYLKVRELVASGDITLKFVASLSNPADVLTKPLDSASFSQHVLSLTGGASIP